MTPANLPAPEDRLPPARIVRWLLLGGVILFSVGLYFRFGVGVAPIGTVPPPASTTP